MNSRQGYGSGPSASRVERISFNGTPSEDVTEFVREVNRVALDQGKRGDDAWMVHYVEACLGGNAIRWFSGLEEDVTSSWKGIRHTLLARFGPPDGRHVPQAATIPNSPIGPGNYIASLEMTIKRLEMSIAQLEATSSTTTASLQRQVDICTKSVTRMQADLTSRITHLGGRRGRIKVVEEGTNKRSYLTKGQRLDYPHFACTSKESESLMFELLVSEGNARRMWLRLLLEGRNLVSLDIKSHKLQCARIDFQEHPIVVEAWLRGNTRDELVPSWPDKTGDLAIGLIKSVTGNGLGGYTGQVPTPEGW
ncbi:hypothetical protein FRB98_001088, partial [Tulasnella sp. 332]